MCKMLSLQRRPLQDILFQSTRKRVMSVKFSARNSGAGNGRTYFMGAWHFLVLSAGKPRMPIKFLVFWRGGALGFSEKGGLEVPTFFLWARGFIFANQTTPKLQEELRLQDFDPLLERLLLNACPAFVELLNNKASTTSQLGL